MNCQKNKLRIIVICGPTGIGKTSVAIALARQFGGEIISADSMQIYKYMDIGTAKPTPEERAVVPHHLVDFVEPDESFDAARFAKLAREKVAALDAQGLVSFVAGGTGLYIKTLTQGIFEAAPVPPEVRTRLREEADTHGSPFLHRRLCQQDPEAAAKLHPNDAFRIIRALEIYETTGQTLSQYHARHRFSDAPFEVLRIGLHMDREALYDRINRRVDIMIAQGLLNEVQGLLDRGYSPDLKSMQSIGYRHMADFIRGDLTWEEAIRTLKRDTRRYAKRQFTWFRADPEVIWTEPDRAEALFPRIKGFLQGCTDINDRETPGAAGG